MRGQNGGHFTYYCPGGGRPATVWGTDIYTDDSSVCTAAVHAGLINFQNGGTVAIEIQPGRSSYQGSTRYGVSTVNYGAWPGSFVFVGGRGGTTFTPPGGSGQGGICDDPRTLAIMDQWLTNAIPPQQPGETLRYEAWGRLVGQSRTAYLRVSGSPETRLTRCQWLWQYAAQMRSTKLGTLRDYVEAQLRR